MARQEATGTKDAFEECSSLEKMLHVWDKFKCLSSSTHLNLFLLSQPVGNDGIMRPIVCNKNKQTNKQFGLVLTSACVQLKKLRGWLQKDWKNVCHIKLFSFPINHSCFHPLPEAPDGAS